MLSVVVGVCINSICNYVRIANCTCVTVTVGITFGGGDGGRFDRGNMPGRALTKARLAPVGDGVCLRTLIGERDNFLRTSGSEF